MGRGSMKKEYRDFVIPIDMVGKISYDGVNILFILYKQRPKAFDAVKEA